MLTQTQLRVPHIAILAGALTLTSRALAVPPTATAVRAESAIDLDGVLDEPAWEAGEWCSGFVVANAEVQADPRPRAAVQTRFKVVFDDDSAYVAVECEEPAIEQLKAETPWRDGAVWQDDCVEIFFDPGNDGRYYHQVMVNARGTIHDLYGADYGLVKSRLWNGAFRGAGHIDREARKWSVELQIPFGAIVLGDDAGSEWRWNVTRERHAAGDLELTSWAPLSGNFHQPRLFGTLTGLPRDYGAFRFRVNEPRVDVSRTGGGVSTLNMALEVRNETGSARQIAATAALLEDGENRVEAEPTAIGRGEAVGLEFPPLSVRGSAPNTNIVFSFQDAATGQLLKAVVKQLSSEYRPISVTLLRPCYRNNIYATEDLKEIVFEVELSAQVRQATEKVSYWLTRPEEIIVAEGAVEAGDLGEAVTIPADGLTEGPYVLGVAAIGADGKQEASTEVALRKLPPPPVGSEVRIDENRNLLVDGKPLLAIGWYGSVPTEDPRADVVALQNVRTPVVINPPDASPISRAFGEQGIYSIVSVENGRLYYSFNLWQQGKEALRAIQDEYHTLTEPSDDTKRLVAELVDAVRGEPGLLGYYIADEPEIHDVRNAYLENYYQYLCELDPYHPVFVTNDTIDGIVTHGYKCADVLDPDPYSPEWDYVPNFLKKVNEVASHGKATYVTLWHASAQAHFTREYGTAPPYPYRVFRNQYFASIAYGAKGFTAYTSPFFVEEIEYRYGLPHVWRELRFLESAVLAPAPAEPVEVEGAPELAAWAKEVNGHVYLILVHHKPGDAEAEVRWEPLATRDSLCVMSEGREVKVEGGAFRDRFAEGDVHVYTDDPAAREFPTVERVMAELQKRHQAAIKPGNLLHWTRGTKVHCSEGHYAPWFHQFYYYAVNGITDDRGWSAYQWQGKPAWIELTLKEPAEIGRLVLYTPNISDYQLDLVAAGGEARRAVVVGNAETIVTHNFSPAVPCLKLRLTATAVRPSEGEGGGAPLLSEVEAYADAGEGPVTPVEVVSAARTGLPVLHDGTEEPDVLWEDDFTNFETAPQYYWDARDTKWVMNPETLDAEARPGGGVIVASASPKGYDAMTHIFPYDPAYRFFQVKLSDITGEGYRFTSVGLASPSGAQGYRGALNTARAGIYTVDTHHIHENYRTGKDTKCFVRVNAAGAHQNPDESVAAGPRFTFDWLRLARRPVDGLAVTMADGGPLGQSIAEGDTLHFEVHLSAAAQDAVVEVLTGSNYAPLAINGEPYVQLYRADETGRVWVGEATLGAGTGKFAPKGYPVVFRAGIVGGDIDETYASAFVAFE